MSEPVSAAKQNPDLFPIIGNLREHFLPEVLFHLYEMHQTGTLVFALGDFKKALIFDKGELVFASSNLKEDSLGEALVRSGMITLTDFAQAENNVNADERIRFGEALIKLGIIDEAGLMQALIYQMHSIIYSLFLWPAGQFRFAKEKMPPHKISKIPLSTLDTILRGTTLIRSWAYLRERLPDLEQRLSPAADFDTRLDMLKLNDYERRILETVQPNVLVSDICVLSPLNEFETCRFLIAGLVIKLLVKH